MATLSLIICVLLSDVKLQYLTCHGIKRTLTGRKTSFVWRSSIYRSSNIHNHENLVNIGQVYFEIIVLPEIVNSQKQQQNIIVGRAYSCAG